MARKFDLPQTKGNFKLSGNVVGTQRKNAFTSGLTSRGFEYNSMELPVQFDKHNQVYIKLFGMPREFVYVSQKNDEGKHEKTIKIPWQDRNKPLKENQSMMGVKLGVTQVERNGDVANEIKTVAEYDAINEIKQNIEDGQGIFVRGSLEFQSYINKDGNASKTINLVPVQFSKTTKFKSIDFEKEDFKPMSVFEQTIVVTEAYEDNGRKYVSGYVIGYNTIESVDFEIKCHSGEKATQSLYNNLKKLKPFTAIRLFGEITNEQVIETVVEDDGWGDEDTFSQVTSFQPMRLIVTGASASTIDTETYTEDEINQALVAIQEFGESTENKPVVKNDNEVENDTNWGDFVSDDDIPF